MNWHVTNCLVGYSRGRRPKWQENEITFVSCKYVSSELSSFLKESVFHYNGKAISLL